ncbi:hypothetical protein Dda_7387 [Drechslerella dactyloides]|uniref:Uncharacterized protein n=1 Tax=Drechslerella dactyloides TaxID=74499 RepID=A0AAD6ISI8_DREDA|nr:hypothetical protein Dda_7387 [Drechslerella dactyloides]
MAPLTGAPPASSALAAIPTLSTAGRNLKYANQITANYHNMQQKRRPQPGLHTFPSSMADEAEI